MSKKPTASEAMARKAAAAVAAMQAEPEPPVPPAPELEPEMEPEHEADPAAEPARKRGRPRGRRPVANRQTVYLDEARYEALARIAEDRGRSIHSLILEGVDTVIGKPAAPGWKPRE